MLCITNYKRIPYKNMLHLEHFESKGEITE